MAFLWVKQAISLILAISWKPSDEPIPFIGHSDRILRKFGYSFVHESI